MNTLLFAAANVHKGAAQASVNVLHRSTEVFRTNASLCHVWH